MFYQNVKKAKRMDPNYKPFKIKATAFYKQTDLYIGRNSMQEEGKQVRSNQSSTQLDSLFEFCRCTTQTVEATITVKSHRSEFTD